MENYANSDDSNLEIPKFDETAVEYESAEVNLQEVGIKPKKARLAVEKENKKRTKNIAKAAQPKEAAKNIRILIDLRIKTIDKKLKIIETMKENNDSLTIISDEILAIENSVCWKRQDPNDPDALVLEPDMCIILSADKLSGLISSVGEDGLFLHVAEIRSRISTETNIRFVVIGLDQVVRQNEKTPGKKCDLKQIIFETSIRSGVTFHQEPDLPSVGIHLVECTKSVAEKFHKLRIKGLKDFLAFAPDLKSVKLNQERQGENVKLCWRRMLQTAIGGRPNADGAAKAISDIYRCPKDLMNAYTKFPSTVECELMLENLIADGLAKVKVGPSISTIVYRTFMLDDPEVTVDKPKK